MVDLVLQTFAINLKILHFMGLYPYGPFNLFYQLQAILMYIIFIIPIPILGVFYMYFQPNLNIVTVADNAFLISEVACYYLKLVPFVFYGQEVKKAILHLEQPVFTMDHNRRQIEIVNNCSAACLRNSRIFLCFVSVTVFSWAIKPIVLGERRFPVDVWLPFDAFSDSTLYFSTYLFIVISVIYAAISSAMVDPLVAGLACLAQGQFQVLKDKLEFLNETLPIAGNRDDAVFLKVIKCIKHHNAILEFLHLYEQNFSLVAFSQFVGSTFVICVSCLQLSIVEPFTLNFFITFMYLCTMLVEVYFYCYYGTAVYQESNSITNAIYMGNWYEYDLKSKKALITIMERSKKPVTLTALKILNLSLDTFTRIIKKSYSLLAVLKNY